jgi:DNA-binding protein HU-beta
VATSHGKADLYGAAASGARVSQETSKRVINAALKRMMGWLRAGHDVSLTGFGTFSVRDIKQRRVRAIRGPNQGKMVTVPAHKRAGFRPGTLLERAVWPDSGQARAGTAASTSGRQAVGAR